MSDWGNFVVTDEQAKAIQNRDINALNKFYFDNYNMIIRMASNYLYKRHIYDITVDDLVNQLYIDLPNLKFNNFKELNCNIILNSFYFCYFSGYSYLLENNKKMISSSSYRGRLMYCLDGVNEDGNSDLIDCFIYKEDNYNEEEDYIGKINDYLIEILSKKEYECFCYKIIDGMSATNIQNKYNMSYFDNNFKSKLILNYKNLLQKLIDSGYEQANYYLNMDNPDYEKVLARLNKKRDFNRRYKELNREKLRQYARDYIKRKTLEQRNQTTNNE